MLSSFLTFPVTSTTQTISHDSLRYSLGPKEAFIKRRRTRASDTSGYTHDAGIHSILGGDVAMQQ